MIQKPLLVLKEIFSGRFISLIVFCSIFASVISAAFFYIAGSNFSDYIDRRFASVIPPNTMKVSPLQKETGVLFFKSKDPSVKQLDGQAVSKIRRMDGIKSVYPVMASAIPMQAKISFFGLNYRTDLSALGVPYRYISRDLKSGEARRRWSSGDFDGEMPVLIPETILNAYNDGMADANNLPRISAKAAEGMSFSLAFGRSSIKELEDHVITRASVAGITNRIDSLALVVPEPAMRMYNRKYNPGFDEYLYAFVEAKGHSELLKASSRISKMGFNVETEKSLSGHIVALKKNAALLIDGLMYLVIFITTVAVAFSTMIAVMNRIEYYRIMRMVGASKLFLSSAVVIKYLVLGLAASGCALAAIRYSAGLIKDIPLVAGLKISLSVPDDLGKAILAAGAAIPVLSTLPALIKLHYKALNID